MTQTSAKRSPIIYAIAVWMIVNIFLMVTLIIGGDAADINNWLETALWIISIPALLSLRKWGFAFTIFTLIYTLSTSVGILIYYLIAVPSVWPNILRVAINIAAIVYLFRLVFRGRFK